MNGEKNRRPSPLQRRVLIVLAAMEQRGTHRVRTRDLEHLLEQGGEVPVYGPNLRASCRRMETAGWLRTLRAPNLQLAVELTDAGRVVAEPLLISEHEKLSNAALGISGTSRDGTKVAIPDDVYKETLDKIREVDAGAAIAMELSRHLGLRTEETMQSVKSLMTWQTVLQSDQEKVRIVFGTKGGRPRDTTIIDRQTLLSVVNNAIRFMKNNNGKLIDKTGIHLAIERYRNIVREAGLIGKYAPHSLRYAYSRDAMQYHLEKGYSQKEAEALVSMDLGHGDGRGHYVTRVYNKLDRDK